MEYYNISVKSFIIKLTLNLLSIFYDLVYFHAFVREPLHFQPLRAEILHARPRFSSHQLESGIFSFAP